MYTARVCALPWYSLYMCYIMEEYLPSLWTCMISWKGTYPCIVHVLYRNWVPIPAVYMCNKNTNQKLLLLFIYPKFLIWLLTFLISTLCYIIMWFASSYILVPFSCSTLHPTFEPNFILCGVAVYTSGQQQHKTPNFLWSDCAFDFGDFKRLVFMKGCLSLHIFQFSGKVWFYLYNMVLWGFIFNEI